MQSRAVKELDLDSIESEILAIWRRILELDSIQPDHDFFYIGGDSLKAVEVMVLVEERYGIVLDPVEILERPTAKEFAAVVRGVLESQLAANGGTPGGEGHREAAS